ncbi:hypothetical protein AB0E00_36760 [Streptomyces sp. NPDC048110]|uniref:hypothetical protein n=1 Tax=Streptomyces sp. NPDC048110 TaxID=3155483 RepID=UPI0033E89652
MTPTQVFTVGALGGLAALVGLVLFVTLAVGLYLLVARLIDAAEEHQEQRRRRRDSDTCQAILALPTTDHPTE